MAQRQNLIDTYNSNPTLQSKYTLDQYLDLFGFGQTTTPTPGIPTPIPTPTPLPGPTPGIPNIINQNLGGGGDGGPSNIPEPVQYFDKTYTGATFPDGTPIMSGFEETEGPGFFQGIANAFDGLAGLYQKFSPIGMIGRKIKQDKEFKQAQTNKALEQVRMQEEIRKAEAAAAAAAAAQAAAAQAAAAEQARLDAAYQQQTITQQQAGGGPGGQFDGASSKQEYDRDPTGYSGSFQDGGRVYLYNRLK